MEQRFLVEPLAEERGGLGLFRVVNDYEVTLSFGIVTIPAGFITDFASIPRPFRWLFPQAGRSALPGAVHDYLSAHQDARANIAFKELLERESAGEFRLVMMGSFVFIFTYPTLHWKWMKDPTTPPANVRPLPPANPA